MDDASFTDDTLLESEATLEAGGERVDLALDPIEGRGVVARGRSTAHR